jgi:hypothetical protein
MQKFIDIKCDHFSNDIEGQRLVEHAPCYMPVMNRVNRTTIPCGLRSLLWVALGVGQFYLNVRPVT